MSEMHILSGSCLEPQSRPLSGIPTYMKAGMKRATPAPKPCQRIVAADICFCMHLAVGPIHHYTSTALLFLIRFFANFSHYASNETKSDAKDEVYKKLIPKQCLFEGMMYKLLPFAVTDLYLPRNVNNFKRNGQHRAKNEQNLS
uniref:Ovule protein n=1 Tax=Steinernema glaseri TaxID=37863 RepID=A0A1I8AM37_9BILA